MLNVLADVSTAVLMALLAALAAVPTGSRAVSACAARADGGSQLVLRCACIPSKFGRSRSEYR